MCVATRAGDGPAQAPAALALLTAAHHLLYLALRGKDWRRAFTPISNRRKLDNGAFVAWALFRALGSLHSPWNTDALLAPFEGAVTPEMLARLRELLPNPSPYRLRPEEFAGGAFPFEAYTAAEEKANA